MRRLRRLAGAALPEFVKQRLRPRLFGYTKSSHASLCQLCQNEDGPYVLVGDHIRIRLTDVDGDHFAALNQMGDSADEFKGFVDAASSTHTLFDVGAHHGSFALTFCMCLERNRAVAFEPSPVLTTVLSQRIALNGVDDRLDVVQKAIGAAEGQLWGSTHASGFIELHREPHNADDFLVEVTTIDRESERLGVIPDILKIDIEGFEYEALAGANRVLQESQPIVFLELHLDILEHRDVAPRDVCGILQEHGYKFYTSLGRPLAASRVYNSPNAVLRCIARV